MSVLALGFAAVLATLPFAAHPSVPVLALEQATTAPAPHLRMLRGTATSFDEARAALDWVPLPDFRSLRGKRTLWLRLDVQSRRQGPWVLALARGFQEAALEVGGQTPIVSGQDVPLAARPLRIETVAFPLRLEPGVPTTLLLRLQCDFEGFLPPEESVVEFSEWGAFVSHDRIDRAAIAMYAGLLLAAIAFNLVFFFWLRDRLFLDYVIYALSFAGIWLNDDGLLMLLLWPQSPSLTPLAALFFVAAAILLGGRFAIRFLHLDKRSPWLQRLVFLGASPAALALLFAAFGQWRAAQQCLAVGALTIVIAWAITGTHAVVSGDRAGRFFLAATGALMLGSLAYVFRYYELLPDVFLTRRGAQIGSALEMVLLMLALADRVSQAEREGRLAEKRVREGLQTEVAQRTADLAEEKARVEEARHALMDTNEKLIAANARLQDLSLTDPLTGLANRRRFEAALESEWRRAARVGLPITVLMIDVDHFKAFNDAWGHPAGDAALKRVGDALTRVCRRGGELVARWGGEEFAVVLPGISEEDGQLRGDAMRAAIPALGLAHGRGTVTGNVTVSVGVATARPQSTDHEHARLLQTADTALYEAKAAGRHRVVVGRWTAPAVGEPPRS